MRIICQIVLVVVVIVAVAGGAVQTKKKKEKGHNGAKRKQPTKGGKGPAKKEAPFAKEEVEEPPPTPKGTEGRMIKCAKGEQRVQSIAPVVVHGCGASFVHGDLDHQFNYTTCCDEQGMCYSTCGQSLDHCDQLFRECISRQCSDSTHNRKEECEAQAALFHHAGEIMGLMNFGAAQRRNCECVPENHVDARFFQHLANIYNKLFRLVGSGVLEEEATAVVARYSADPLQGPNLLLETLLAHPEIVHRKRRRKRVVVVEEPEVFEE